MSDIQLYLIEAGKDRAEARRIAAETAAKLERREIQLLTLIESIGEYINHEDNTLRDQSIAFLADTVDQLSSKILSLQHRLLLTEFVLSRIQDDPGSTPACARALVALERLGRWDAETVKKIISALVTQPQTLRDFKLQADRFAVLQLVDTLLAKYRSAVNERAKDDDQFISSFTSYFEGEKDPRNLMLVFSIVLVAMNEWNLGPSTQDMFDLVFNYFPITFKPPPGDPFGITAQDLKDRLRACIASTADFAPYSFPALLDKLDSSSMNTKRDVLQAIISCVENYGPATVSLYSVTLWDALKFEILNVQEANLAESALQALAAIARQTQTASEGAMIAYLKPMVKECNEHLEDAPTKQSEAAGRILACAVRAGPDVSDYIVKGVLPGMLTLFQASDMIAKRRGLFEVLDQILFALKSISPQWIIRDEDGIIRSDRAETQAMRVCSKDILNILVQAATSAPKKELSFRLVSLQCLEHMIDVRQLLSESDISQILDVATGLVIDDSDSGSDEVGAAAIKVVLAAARLYPQAAIEKVIPGLVAQLPDSPEAGIFTYEAALEVLAKLSVEPQLADTVILRIKNKLHAARRSQAPKTYIVALLAALLYIFTNGSPPTEDGHIRITYFTDMIKPLLEEAVSLEDGGGNPLQSEVITDIICRLSNLIIRDQSQHAQNQVFASLSTVLTSLDATISTPEAARQRRSGSRLRVIASLYLHASFYANIYPDGVPHQLLQTLLDVVSQGDNTTLIHRSALRHLTILVNKFVAPPDLENVLSGFRRDIDAAASPGSHDVGLDFAILKGILVSGKSGKVASRLLEDLLRKLDSPDIGANVAEGFYNVLALDDLLIKENHCIISGLYKQKTYHQCCTIIAARAPQSDPTVRPNYLIALSGILRNMPYEIIKPSLKSITTLLLQSLDLDGNELQKVKASALVTIEAVLMHDADLISEHSSSIINRLLDSAETQTNHEEVRSGALRCLRIVPTHFKREIVVPHRQQVVRKLLIPLDDHKRSVRAEAVRCRTAWLALDRDDEDEG